MLITGGKRTLAGFAATVLLVWLNTWWVLPLVGIMTALPPLLEWPRDTVTLLGGHLFALLLILAASGAFSPRRGSPAELALRAELRGDFLAAGEFWAEARRENRSFRAFTRAGAWGRAAEVTQVASRLRHVVAMLQREGGGSLGLAAQIAARVGDDSLAQQLLLRHGQYLFENRQFEAAIEPFVRAGDPRRAARAVELALEAQQHLAPTVVDTALRACRDAKRPQLGAAVALAAGRHRDAGEFFLAADQPLEAARAFERAGETMRAAEALNQAGRGGEAIRLKAQRLVAAGQSEQAAEEYERAGMHGESAQILTQLGRHQKAFDLYQRAGLLREAAEVGRDHGRPREAARFFAELEEWGEAGICWERAGEPNEAARCFRLSGDYDRALEMLAATGKLAEQATLLAELGRVEEAFLLLFRDHRMGEAWELISRFGGTFPALRDALVELAAWLRQNSDLTGAISAVQRATAGHPADRDLLPALYTLAALLEEHGDLRAAEGAWQRIVDFEYAYRDAAQRLQSVAQRRALDESQISGKFRVVGPDAAAAPGGDTTSRYIIEQELGRGGMGVVYRARDQRLGRTVAIKVLNPRQHTPEAIRRFEREARAAAALSHPGIVHIYDFDRGFESFFISMEYVSGPTLNQLVREEPAFVRRQLVPIMRQIVEAVAYAHERHVVHRDLKPANMILSDRKQLKILDFGIARRLDEMEATASGATGTPFYMAPEQILGEDPDERTDVYSLGVTFFQLSTGRLPFASGNILRAHLDSPPPDPQDLATDLEPAISHMILRCMAKDPAQRYRDGGALVAALATMGRDASP